MDNIKERKVSIIKSFRNRLIGITNEISDELSEIRSHWYDWYDKKIYDENSLNLLVASYSSSFNSLKILVEENDEFIDKNWNPNMHITDHDKNEINKLDFSASQMACLILPGHSWFFIFIFSFIFSFKKIKIWWKKCWVWG